MKKSILFMLLASAATHAQIIFQDDFSAYNTGVMLSGQGDWTNNSSSPGGLGSCAGGGCVNSTIESFNLTYPNYGSSDKALSISINRDAVGKAFPGVSSGSFYVSFAINFSSAVNDPGGSSSQDFFRVMSGDNYSTAFRLGAVNTGFGFQLFIQKGSATKVFSGDLAYGTTHLVVMKYTINPGTNDDTVSLFTDPDMSGAEPAPTAIAALGTEYAAAIDRLNFRSNWSTIPTGYVGLVKTATSWSSLLSARNFDSQKSFVVSAAGLNNGLLAVRSSQEMRATNIDIYTTDGKLVCSRRSDLRQGDNEITVQPLSSGTYIVSIRNGKLVSSHKVIVR